MWLLGMQISAPLWVWVIFAGLSILFVLSVSRAVISLTKVDRVDGKHKRPE